MYEPKPPRWHVARAPLLARVAGVAVACSHGSSSSAESLSSSDPSSPAPALSSPKPATQATPGHCVNAPDGGPDVVVTVSATRGPKGAAAPVSSDRRLYGMSIADWMPDDYVPTPNPKYLSFLQ